MDVKLFKYRHISTFIQLKSHCLGSLDLLQDRFLNDCCQNSQHVINDPVRPVIGALTNLKSMQTFGFQLLQSNIATMKIVIGINTLYYLFKFTITFNVTEFNHKLLT